MGSREARRRTTGLMTILVAGNARWYGEYLRHGAAGAGIVFSVADRICRGQLLPAEAPAGMTRGCGSNLHQIWGAEAAKLGTSPDAGRCGARLSCPRYNVRAIGEAAMIKPRDIHHDPETEAATADLEPEVTPELIKDLDVAGDDADNIAGGCSWTRVTGNPN